MPFLIARAAGLWLFAVALSAAQPWDTTFAPDTAAISAAAQSLPVDGDPPAVMLLEEHSYTIDKQGRISSRVRYVYLIRRREPDESWNSVQWGYQPWYEDRPEIRARVIAPGGSVRTFDPSTLADAPANQYSANIYSDRRVVRAPLPGIEAGVVVEQEIVISESRPQLDAGSVRRIAVRQHIPLQRFRLSINAHRRVALRTSVHGISPEALEESTSRNGTGVRLDLDALPVIKDFEFNAPPDQVARKYITFSTGPSWQALAAAYAQVIEDKIAQADLATFLADLDLTGTPLDVAATVTAELHRQIRYTGVEFAEAEIIPGTPAQTLTRGYGDCKDKSTLLVALLRAAGLDAHVALLAAGSEPDVDLQNPGLGLFNHVIVYVDAESPFWIDATAASARVAVLPLPDEGRLALIAKPETTELVATPLSRSEDNWRHRTTTIRMSDFGGASLQEITEAGGSLEVGFRIRFGSDSSSVRKSIEETVRRNLQGKVTNLETSDRFDFSSPFRVSLEVENAAGISTTMEEATVGLYSADLFEHLPFALTMGIAGLADNADEKRQSDVWFDQPYHIKLRYRIHPPALFKAVSLPESEDLALGPASYSQSVETLDDAAGEIGYEFDSGNRRWSAEEVKAFQQAAKPYYSAPPLTIRFIPRSAELTALGETRAALDQLREYIEAYPDNGPARARFSRLLITAGLGEVAKHEALRATEIAPGSVAAWLALGWAHQHDAFGRRFRGDWDRGQAVTALRKAVELDPELNLALKELASLLDHDGRGVRYGPGADLAESTKIYEGLLDQQPLVATQTNLITALVHSGRLDEAKKRMKLGRRGLENSFTLLIKGLEEGPAAVILAAQANVADPEARADLLWTTSFSLLRMRRYDLALPIYKASARIRAQQWPQQLLQILARLQPYEDGAPLDDDARGPVWETLAALLADSGDPYALKQTFTARDDWSAWQAEIRALGARVRQAKAQTRAYGFEESTAVDFALATIDLGSEGDDQRGFRVSGEGQPSFLVVRENDQYRIIGSSYNLAEVGKLVWRLVEEGDIDSAQWWLDEALKCLRSDTGDGVTTTEMLWSGTSDELRGLGDAKIAAATLVGRTEPSDFAIQILREAAQNASVTTDRNQANVALAEALETAKEWKALAEVARVLGKSGLFASEGLDYALRAARGSGEWIELSQLAEERLQETSDDRGALRLLAEAGAHRQDLASVERATSKLLDDSFVPLGDLVLDAWVRRILGQADPARLSRLQKNVEKYQDPGGDFYFTQGMMQAALDQPEEAMRSLRLAVGDQNPILFGPKAWFIQANICELYGFPDTAEVLRQRARSAIPDDDIDRWALAALDSADQ